MKCLAIGFMALLLAGCDQQMADMPRHDTYQVPPRPPVEGAVAREDEQLDRQAAPPKTIDTALLARGQERFGIFCSPCHSPLGDGDGLIVRRGFPHPPSFHQKALRKALDSHYYDVITRGYGVMYPYASRVPPADRWAIITYIRALQYSQYAPAAALPEDLRKKLAGRP